MRRACEIEAEALAIARETSAPQRTVLEQMQEAAALAKRGDLSLGHVTQQGFADSPLEGTAHAVKIRAFEGED